MYCGVNCELGRFVDDGVLCTAVSEEVRTLTRTRILLALCSDWITLIVFELGVLVGFATPVTPFDMKSGMSAREHHA